MLVKPRLSRVVPVVLAALLSVACSDLNERPPGLKLPPWVISAPSPDQLDALGVSLGRTTVAEAEKRWGRVLEKAVFSFRDGRNEVEAFAGKLSFGGIEGRLVAPLDVDADTAELYASRATDRKPQPSLSIKQELQAVDSQALGTVVLDRLMFVPATKKLETAMLEQRFGKPSSRSERGENGVTLWTYPDKGLVIIHDPEGPEVMHFVPPASFPELLKLLETGPGGTDAAATA
ncbi:MAG: hypothetical protein ACPGU7_00915 [Gammaproteobacteria bacterium]